MTDILRATFTLCGILASTLATADEWHDPSTHHASMVEVEKDVRLEVLDWGGSGRAVVLLAGLGNTAHVFDDVAPRLAKHYRVYGITRRGYGASSVPEQGYGTDRLADDVLAVIQTLKLKRPIVIGHSIAGLELSSIGSRYADRIGGLLYLDATFTWDPAFEAGAWYSVAPWRDHLNELQAKLSALSKEPDDPMPLIAEVLDTTWPAMEKDLREFQRADRGRPPRPPATAADLQSFGTVREWYSRGSKVHLPEAEFRQLLATDADGKPTMKRRWPPRVPKEILSGRQMFTSLTAPALAIFGVWNDPGQADLNDPEQRADADTYSAVQKARVSRRVEYFKQIAPSARVVVIERTDHYLFVMHEGEVLQQIQAFVAGLD
ncbi:MAG TPA: alpha/beta hydrolase [Pyrinomonadaceae bacterium]